jgi:hypothetical protein
VDLRLDDARVGIDDDRIIYRSTLKARSVNAP